VITGALLDLLLDTRGGAFPVGGEFLAVLTESGMEIRLKTKTSPVESRPGYEMLKRLASSIRIDSDDQLIIEITGASVAVGFPRRPEGGSAPVIAR
jgi:hypothetical protein